MACTGKYKEWQKPEKLILLTGWAQDGLTDKQIAERIGINVKTLYDWKNKYKTIDNALKQGKEVVDYAVQNTLLKAAREGDITACIYWLNNRQPDKWRNKAKVLKEIDQLLRDKLKLEISSVQNQNSNESDWEAVLKDIEKDLGKQNA